MFTRGIRAEPGSGGAAGVLIPGFLDRIFPLLSAIRCFPAILAAALLVAPVNFFTAILTFTPVRRGERFVDHPPVGYPQPAFALSPVFPVPAIHPDPAFSGTAAPVIPADTGSPAADICTVIHRISGRHVRVLFLTHGNLEITAGWPQITTSKREFDR
jgi:hypothetical protein